MNQQEFLEMSLGALSEKTSLDKAFWSKVFSGHLVTERTLNRISDSLNMPPHRVLEAINLRRKWGRSKLSA